MASNDGTEVEMTPRRQPSSSATPTHVASLENEPVDAYRSNEGFSLPPTDGGKDAWLCLFACFMLEALIWGMFSWFSMG
jgi:hypothetical protein